jgi:hypothetical protein
MRKSTGLARGRRAGGGRPRQITDTLRRVTTPTEPTRPTNPHCLVAWIGSIVLLLAGIGMYVQRGPLLTRDPGSNIDASLVLTSARVFLHGRNPYDLATVDAEWMKEPGFAGARITERGRGAIVYPPSTYLLASPIAALDLKTRTLLWNGLASIAYPISVLILLSFARLRLLSPAGLTMLGLSLISCGASKTISLGQPGSFAFLFLSLSLFLMGRLIPEDGGASAARGRTRTDWLAGLALGIAIAIKPQLAGLFVAYALGRGRWRMVLGTGVAAAALFGLGALRLALTHEPWMESWRGNLETFWSGGEGDPAGQSNRIFMLINLQNPLHYLGFSESAAKAIGTGLPVLVALVYAAIDGMRGGAKGEGMRELASLSMVATVSLLVTYHRYYDAILMAIVAALVVVLWIRGLRASAIVTMLFLAVLLVPGPAILLKLNMSGRLSDAIYASPLVQRGLLFQHTYALVGLLVWLPVLRSRLPRADRSV